MVSILLATITFVTNPSDPALTFDGYKVERQGVDYVITVCAHAGELFAGAVGRTFSFYAVPAQERQVTLGSPINLARDIRDQAK